jgi:hypothetical protein
MIRKLLVVAAAIAMPISIVAVSGGVASAANPHTAANPQTAATDTIICKDISGKVTFSPKEDKNGYTSGSIHSSISATLTGCTVSGATHETVSKGVVTGTLVGTAGTVAKPAGKCSSLVGNSVDVGSLTTKWTATPAVPNSVLGVKSVTGGTHGSYGTFKIPGSTKGTPSGSFLGANHGSSDTSTSQTVLSAGTLITDCDNSGLSTLSITTDSAVAAVSLG